MTYLILHLGPLTTLLQGLQEGLQLCSPFYFVVRTTNSPAGEILLCHFKAWRQKKRVYNEMHVQTKGFSPNACKNLIFAFSHVLKVILPNLHV